MADESDMRSLRFAGNLIEHWPDCTRTVLVNGDEVVAAPQDNDEYRATAVRLGYGADTSRMMRDHEATHTALAVLLRLPESPTLRRVALGLESTPLTDLEEEAVCAIQTFANAAGADLSASLARLATALSSQSPPPLIAGPPLPRRETQPRNR